MIDFCVIFSAICEILALISAFYFKHTRIFFLSLCLLEARIFYFFSSAFMVNLFNSLFLPMIFCFLCLKKNTELIKDKKNISAILALIFVGILGIFLPRNTSFNASVLDFQIFSAFKPMSELGFVFFVFLALFLALKCLKTKEFYLLFAFFGMYVGFFFENNFSFFEFASLIFVFYFAFKLYKNAFFDALTLLPNSKSLSRFVRGREFYIIALLHFSELEFTQTGYVKLILRKVAKILRRLRAKIFVLDYDFIFIFDDKNEALRHLAYLESLLKNTEFELENTNFKLEFKITWQENAQSLAQSIQSLRKNLA